MYPLDHPYIFININGNIYIVPLQYVRIVVNGGGTMSEGKETPERRRENLKQEEIKRNPTGNINDAFSRNEAGNLSGLAGGLGWKGLGVLILVIIIGFIVASIFLK